MTSGPAPRAALDQLDRLKEVPAAPERPSPLPRLQVAFLCCVDASHFYTVCSIFSYAAVLSADLHWVADRNEAGFVAGWLQSANVFGRVLTSTVWGFVAMRWGFRPILALTLFALLTGGVLFGLCTNLMGAMCIRFIFFGMLNGWPAIYGPIAASVAGDDRQTDVIGMLLAAGSGMQLVGPAIGGWTYNFLPTLPALIPSLIGCMMALASLALFSRVHHGIRKPQAEEAKDVDQSPGTPSKSPRTAWSVLRAWPVPLVIFMRLWNGFALFAIFEAAPLWLVSDRELGGLGMSEKQVGSLLSRSGLWNLFFFSFVLPYLARAVGGRGVSAIFSVIGAAGATLLPSSTSTVVANGFHLVTASAMMSQAAMNITFTNNAAGQADRAVVTGVAVTVETIGKALGPILTSTMFAWCLRHWGFDGHGAVFYVLAAFSGIQLACTLLLPSFVESPEFLRRRGHELVAVEEPQKEIPATVLGVEEATPVMLRAHSA
ncbi:ZIFL2 [Symbiodinium natans]|uniref:ZIFL2 protein n=1 Tax=Symbiodinium natans TaxID=878477 RepID=A0A812Q0A1_9DINO|nr:ZIFL2 [Symbiodinium natans]